MTGLATSGNSSGSFVIFVDWGSMVYLIVEFFLEKL
jgi:hypothetical protein